MEYSLCLFSAHFLSVYLDACSEERFVPQNGAQPLRIRSIGIFEITAMWLCIGDCQRSRSEVVRSTLGQGGGRFYKFYWRHTGQSQRIRPSKHDPSSSPIPPLPSILHVLDHPFGAYHIVHRPAALARHLGRRHCGTGLCR